MNTFLPDEKYMRRAIELALNGELHSSPNPNVGAVIVSPDGRIIGEGWHRRCGGPHAEVNAVASVRPCDEALLAESTIYVTLEPCSHWGKTPPCSKLLIEKRIPRVVVGMTDPFSKVSGNGIRMLREAGAEVIENFLEHECRALNRRFITAHTLRRPYIQLKWAQSSDGFIAALENGRPMPVRLSNPLSMRLMHKERALADAIMVGTGTIIADNPSLTTRLWPGQSPRPVIFKSERIPENTNILLRDPVILDPLKDLSQNMNLLYEEYGITSLMAEGGEKLLHSFIDSGIVDEIRVEIAQKKIMNGLTAPKIPAGFRLVGSEKAEKNVILYYHNDYNSSC